MDDMARLGEGGLIALAQAIAGPTPAGGLGIGDDAALVPGAGPVLAALDQLVEGVHFRRATMPASDLGWKALAVNLSDLAAMGGAPTAALVGLALPADLDPAYAEGFWAGFGELARAHGVWLAGGDTTGSPGPIMAAVTVLGRPGPRVLTRAGAIPGDVVFMTGTPGRSAAGLAMLEARLADPARPIAAPEDAIALAIAAHRRPVPQLAAGRALAALGVRLALIDDSDGLARSCQLLARAGGVAITLDPAALAPDPATAAIAAALGAAARDWLLFGGEDFGLVGACAPADWPAVEAALAGAGHPGRRVGGCAAAGPCELAIATAAGPPDALAGEMGYAHFARTSFPPR